MENRIFLDATPDPKVLIALTHTDMKPLDALCELIDNAIDSFSSAKLQGIIIDKPTIRVALPKQSEIDNNKGQIIISDNGPGLTKESAEHAIRAGYSSNNPYDTLGLFGMGFNISTGKMGSITSILTQREGDEETIEFSIDLNKINENKSYQIEAFRRPKDVAAHGTTIQITNWWPEGNPNRGFVKNLVSLGVRKIKDELGRRYATILRNGEIAIVVGDSFCEPFEHCVWGEDRYVERRKHGKIYARQTFDTVVYSQRKCMKCSASLEPGQTSCPACGSNEIRTIDEHIRGWIGIQRYDHATDFGIDLIRNGRAIKKSEKSAFFEFTDDLGNVIKDYPIDQNYGRIVGEIELNHVPVDFTKQDFQRSSPEWNRAMKFIRGESSLQPTQPGAENNNSPLFRLYQGYRRTATAGKTDMYMGSWDSTKDAPQRMVI